MLKPATTLRHPLLEANRLEVLPWDSDFFGFPIYGLALRGPAPLAGLLAEAAGRGAKLVYIFADPADAAANTAVRNLHLPLADRKLTYAMPAGVPRAPLDLLALHRVHAPTSALEELAVQSGAYSRFRRDVHFAPGAFERLYTHWLHQSFNGEMANVVLAYYPATAPKPLGLLTLGLQPGRADIGLLAVAPQQRGQGIGQQLLYAARHLAAHWQVPTLQVVTQADNPAACRFYERCGFRREHLTHLYHAWLGAADRPLPLYA